MNEITFPSPNFFNPGQFAFGKVSETGISISEGIPQTEWLKVTEEACLYWEKTGKEHAKAAFIIGDLLAFGDKHLHDTYGQAIDATREYIRLRAGQLKRWMWVATKVQASRRRELLSLAHHEDVAGLDPELQESYLQMAVDEAMTSKELRAQIRKDNPKAKKPRKNSATETPDQTPKQILEQMIHVSNWVSAHPDEITDEMEEPMHKFYNVYRRRFIK